MYEGKELTPVPSPISRNSRTIKIVHLNFHFYQYSEGLYDFLISFISSLPKEVSEKGVYDYRLIIAPVTR